MRGGGWGIKFISVKSAVNRTFAEPEILQILDFLIHD